MLTLRPSVIQCLRLGREFRASCQSRLLHGSGKGEESFRRVQVSQPLRRPSLREELFPEEVQQDGYQKFNFDGHVQNVPRLPLPEVDDLAGESDLESDYKRKQLSRVTKIDFRGQQLAVLSLSTGSKSLVESDFRRIAPKGRHIDDWSGPGDILKIIPMRDPTTLKPAGRYFILFTNSLHARTYQDHVFRLHRLAKTHTPTSIESPLPLQPGVVIEGEDAYTLLQDFSLCPPSQTIQLKLLSPLNPAGQMKRVLDQRGYRPISGETDKARRSVLFSVDGQHFSTAMIKHTLVADGRDRGLAWDISIDRLDNSIEAADGFEDSMSTSTEEHAELGARRHSPSTWVISFTNENEARRFIRAWHRRPFPPTRGVPSARSDDPALVQAEFIW